MASPTRHHGHGGGGGGGGGGAGGGNGTFATTFEFKSKALSVAVAVAGTAVVVTDPAKLSASWMGGRRVIKLGGTLNLKSCSDWVKSVLSSSSRHLAVFRLAPTPGDDGAAGDYATCRQYLMKERHVLAGRLDRDTEEGRKHANVYLVPPLPARMVEGADADTGAAAMLKLLKRATNGYLGFESSMHLVVTYKPSRGGK